MSLLSLILLSSILVLDHAWFSTCDKHDYGEAVEYLARCLKGTLTLSHGTLGEIRALNCMQIDMFQAVT